ncbi:uncharacterized protein BKA78DRAFT_310607 [Phyllosticta capitalensis]|uniref:uncharacterized protein n=1 Tax=Phyllosticta capitalensis TaxID=121624 RepID=UPI0031311B0C
MLMCAGNFSRGPRQACGSTSGRLYSATHEAFAVLSRIDSTQLTRWGGSSGSTILVNSVFPIAHLFFSPRVPALSSWIQALSL